MHTPKLAVRGVSMETNLCLQICEVRVRCLRCLSLLKSSGNYKYHLH
jgi:hypothetical protein